MYSGYGAASPPLTNNPFISTGGNISQRFPDIHSTSPPPNQYSSSQWGDPNAMYAQQQAQQQQMLAQQQYEQQQQYYQQQQQQQQSQMYQQQASVGGGGYSGFASHSGGFQPSSSFGQQLARNISGSSYGYLQGNSGGQGQSTGYNPAAQQLQSNPNYVAAFDPYGPIAQGWGDSSGSGSGMGNGGQHSTGGGGGYNANGGNMGMGYGGGFGGGAAGASQFVAPSGAAGYSPSGDPHPREYLRTHKAQVEAWDGFAWKQFLAAFDVLKREWEKRRDELKTKAGQAQAQAQQIQTQYGTFGGGYALQQLQQEAARLQGLQKEADLNCDSVAASTFQMQEVFQNYRQSGDAASKRRVRDATNASLQSLPGWPGQY